jgi:acetolactate synthase I/II/III large subunit
MATVVQAIAHTLKGLGIRRMFGVPGGEILDLIEACRQEGIEFILTRHESAAAFMADVTGQITGRPGVCLSTVGPGATNLVNGVANAFLDRSPVLVFTAQPPTSFHPYANHQYLALERLFEPVTKKVFTITGQDTRRMVEEGYGTAITGPKGPVYFCLPRDVAAKEETPGEESSLSGQARSHDAAGPEILSRAIEALRSARRPLVLLGIGIDPKGESEIVRRFIRKNRLPVFGTPKSKGVFPESDPLYLGTASGMMADDLIVEKIKEADLVVGIGFDPVESDKIWHKDITLLSINPYSLAYRSYAPSMEILGKIRTILDRLLNEDFSLHDWTDEEFRGFRERMKKKLTPTNKPRRGTFSPYGIVQKTRSILSADSVVTTDVGVHKYIIGQAWESVQPLTFFMSNGLSSMGYGLPAAIAAKLEMPERNVVCVSGDGGFSMMLQDLETAVRLRLPIVFLVFCDGSLGLIELVQKRRGLPRYGVGFERIRFAQVAKAFGARGIKLGSLEELSEIFSAAFESDRPTVLEIPIDGTEYMGQL